MVKYKKKNIITAFPEVMEPRRNIINEEKLKTRKNENKIL